MSRMIDADKLKEDLTRFYDGEVTARQLIDAQPSAQPEPCEDAVSRNLVLSEVKSGMIRTIDGENWKRVSDNVRDILAMPSVTPKQRTGKWIHVSEEMWKCDQCGEISCCSPNFCPDCGSRNEVTE